MLGLYGMLEFNICCEILLLMDMADMDRWKTGVSNAECLVHLVNRLEIFVVYIGHKM